ncbi:MAG: DNA polymerase III subunit delta [Calditrichaeota bacterium]|nr:DNA polymerase III subunit delta [Calditrichota bacterium]MCB9366348.1 DNA polymerase III subunit delta [Calditrichota bacterium]
MAEAVPAYRKLVKAVSEGDGFPVLMLGGTEELLIDAARKLVLNYLLSDANADFDYFECEGDAVDAATLHEQLSALPMFGTRRVILINDPDGMKKQDVKEVLKNYVARPSPTTSLVMLQPMDRKPNRFEIQRLQAAPNSCWFFELKADELAKFVRNFVLEAGKEIESGAVDYLIEHSSAQLRDLQAKLEHLILFAGETKEVTAEMAMRATGVTAEVDLLDFEDAILDGNASRVLREARELLDKGMEPLAMLGRLRLLTHKVWLCGALADRRAKEDDYKDVLGFQAFKKNSFISSAKRWGGSRQQDLMLNLLQIEMHAKSKSSDVRSMIFQWLWNASSRKYSGTPGTKTNEWEFVK